MAGEMISAVSIALGRIDVSTTSARISPLRARRSRRAST
jgi:hypothetical protein